MERPRLRAAIGAAGAACGLGYLLAGDAVGVGVVLKPWPVWALAALAAGQSRTRRGVTVGLLLSGVADVAIELVFVAGMVAFAAAHLAYIGAFLAISRRVAWPALPPFLLWPAALLGTVWPGLGELRGPVAGYAVVLGAMMWRAVATGSVWIGVGAVVFGVSDSLLALRLGGIELPFHSLAVMATYWAGQALLAAGAATSRDP